MKRSTASILGVLTVAVLAVGVGILLRLDTSDRSAAPTATKAPLADYHPSSPAMIASTARPQLLEFFHPQ